MSFLVVENPAERRFEILVDDALAGFAAYEPRGEVLVFTHTEVDERFQNMGVGAALVRGALDQVRERGGRLVPRCSFLAAFIERHPEYADLVVPDA
ncbi:GNAT family N-acetyltransferase [Micromonospora sp. HK10]|uniref:GNAT family N-acetyltransferase n=1 Tax=Micromonospora sp. HK10 TaxID=1538294 RepID=UPI00062704C2|nr:GNAT family N-acetyltransferase [Micromonospora sp. HK10]KKK05600.1 acetyltransferase [Micromonospora sp. HK10]